MKDLIQETVEKIKKEKIEPTAKWKFIAKDSCAWFLCFFLILLGAIATGLILFLLFDLDWDIYSDFNRLGFKLIFNTIPYFWLITLLLLFAFSLLSFRKTKHGYRYSALSVVLISLTLIFFFGIVAHFLHAGKFFHNLISQKVPQYEKLNNLKEREWSEPELGLLGGVIIKIKDQGFDLMDFEGENWMVDYDNNTLIKCETPFEIKEKVKVIGKQLKGQHFWANEIRPWERKWLGSKTTNVMQEREN